MLQSSTLERGGLVGRSPVFYGWVIWVVATVGLIATSPGQTFSVSLFIDRFIDDFAISRTTVSTLYGVATFIGALSLTWVGRQLDRRGSRVVGTAVTGFFAVALVAMSLVNGPLALFIGFVALRGLGQGSLSLVNTTVIAQWFARRRGRVLALLLVVFQLFQSAYVPVVQNLIDTYGWRPVWIMLGIFVAATALPLMFFLMRNRPEDFGLQPDGATVSQSEEGDDSQADEDNWTLGEARHTAIFWVFLMARIMTPAWGTGLIFHQISIFELLGYEASVATATFSRGVLLAAGIALIAGVLVDKLQPGRVVALQLSGTMLAIFLATTMNAGWMLWLYAVGVGVVMGVGGVFDGAVWANMYGRKHLGAIRGFVFTALISGSAAGPIIFGFSFDQFGSYNPALFAGLALGMIPFVLSFLVRQPPRPQPAVSPSVLRPAGRD